MSGQHSHSQLGGTRNVGITIWLSSSAGRSVARKWNRVENPSIAGHLTQNNSDFWDTIIYMRLGVVGERWAGSCNRLSHHPPSTYLTRTLRSKVWTLSVSSSRRQIPAAYPL